MKTAFYVVFLLMTLFVASVACSRQSATVSSPLDAAEQAFSAGRYAKAQNIADSIMLGTTFGQLSAPELCRLSLLFTRLGEYSGDEQANTAMGARALVAAYERDSDSTAYFLRNVSIDDRARMAIIIALSKLTDRQDSIIEEPDSLVY